MAIPDGYILAEPNVDYGLVDYYIDSSVTPYNGSSSFWFTTFLDSYDDTFFGSLDSNYGVVYLSYKYNNTSYRIWEHLDGWNNANNGAHYTQTNIVDGKISIPNVATIQQAKVYFDSNVTNNWLYVKDPHPEYIAEPLYLESELQASKAVEVTGSGSVTVQPDSGFVAVKEVVVTTNIQSGDYVMSEVANATGTTVVFTYAGSGYTVTLNTDTINSGAGSAINTYLSTTQPTSASDYDYEALGENRLYDNSGSSTALTQPVTFNATELWIWGYGYKVDDGSVITDNVGSIYTNAKKVTLTKNTAFTLVNKSYVSSND